MAIQRVSGNILQDNLQRGANLSIQGNLAYFDVTNSRVGILTDTPQDEFTVIGVANASNVRITSATANGVFFAGNTLLAITNSGFTYDGINVEVTANLTAGNLISDGAVVGNIDVGNISVSGNISVESLTANLFITAQGNITGGNLISNNGIYTQTANVSGNVNAGNVNVVSAVNAATGFFTGNVDVLGNLNATIGVVYANSGIFYGNAVTGNNAAFAGIPGFTQLGSNVVMQFAGNVNSYSQLNFQNINNGTLASTDFVATADNGTDTTNYVNMGINSSTFNDPTSYPGYGPNDSYVHNHGGNLILNPESTGKTILLMVGGTDTANVVANVSSTGIEIYGLLDVSGNASVGNILTDGYYYANGAPVDFQQPAGANTEIQYNFNSDFGASANLTYNQATNIFQVGYGANGAIQTDTLTVTGNISGDNITAQGNIDVDGDAIINGNLTVNGDLVYNNVTSLNIEDPIISMGRGANNTPLVSDDGKDRGEQLWYYSGTEKSAFIGYDNSAGNLIAAIDVAIANEIVTVTQFGTWQVGNVYAESAVITGNLSMAGQLTVTGNITGGNLVSNASVSAGTTISATGNITGGNLVSNAAISAVTTISAAGNIVGNNVISNNRIVGTTLDINGDALVAGNLTVQGNITYINIDDLRVEDPIIQLGGGANGNALITNDGKDRGTLLTYYTTGPGNAFVGWDNSSGNMVVASDVTIANNIVTVNSFGTLQAGNIYAESALITGNVNLGNISTTGQITATGNITGGNIIANALLSAVDAQVTSLTANRVVYVGANDYLIDSANFTFDGSNVVVLGQASIDNIIIDSSAITSNTNLLITASTGNLVLTPGPSSITQVVSTTSFTLPRGNTAQRPAIPDLGTIRFNTNIQAVEVWDGTVWEPVGQDFVQVTSQIIDGDGSTAVFTLDNSTTAAAIIVSVNGVLQYPNISYTVAGNLITFAEAPQISDQIDVRFTTAVSTVNAITNESGNAEIAVTTQGVATIATCDSLQLPTYSVAQAANIASPAAGQVIYVSNGDSGNPCLAVYSSGAWKRVALGANISA
jgi:cytoskeletal protein CcmA (bactofilin family)